MSRRVSSDKIFSRKKEGKKKAEFNRSKMNIKKLESVLVSCEGTKTEPLYFNSFFNYLVKTHKISALSFVIADHKHTDPKGVLDDLLQYKEGNNTYKSFKHKWIVIDRDEERTNGGGHSLENYSCAIDRAKKLNIEVAFSNPSFEIWYLLHYQYRNTSLTRDDVVEELEKIIDYKKNDEDMFNKLFGNQDIAIRNAENLLRDGVCLSGTCNPSTNIHTLVKCLLDIK
jgi:hypothetical protein